MENIVCEMAAILSRGRRVNTSSTGLMMQTVSSLCLQIFQYNSVLGHHEAQKSRHIFLKVFFGYQCFLLVRWSHSKQLMIFQSHNTFHYCCDISIKYLISHCLAALYNYIFLLIFSFSFLISIDVSSHLAKWWAQCPAFCIVRPFDGKAWWYQTLWWSQTLSWYGLVISNPVMIRVILDHLMPKFDDLRSLLCKAWWLRPRNVTVRLGYSKPFKSKACWSWW